MKNSVKNAIEGGFNREEAASWARPAFVSASILGCSGEGTVETGAPSAQSLVEVPVSLVAPGLEMTGKTVMRTFVYMVALRESDRLPLIKPRLDDLDRCITRWSLRVKSTYCDAEIPRSLVESPDLLKIIQSCRIVLVDCVVLEDADVMSGEVPCHLSEAARQRRIVVWALKQEQLLDDHSVLLIVLLADQDMAMIARLSRRWRRVKRAPKHIVYQGPS